MSKTSRSSLNRRGAGIRRRRSVFLFAAAGLRACLKSLRSECGRPRPQQCPTSKHSRFLQCPSQCHVAAPEDGRTPSESCFHSKAHFQTGSQSKWSCLWRLCSITRLAQLPAALGFARLLVVERATPARGNESSSRRPPAPRRNTFQDS